MRQTTPQEFHLTVTELDSACLDLLADHSGLSRSLLKQTIDKGALWLSRRGHTRRLRRIKTALQIGDQLHLYYNPAVLNQVPTPPTLIDDAGDYSVWYKPGGVFSQGSKWGDHCSLHRLAEKQLQRATFPVHRLDRAAHGLIVIAHSKQCARTLAGYFAQREVEKTYRAIVSGDIPVEPVTVTAPIDGKEAVSRVHLLERCGNRALLQIQIETGRKHQIRRHLAVLGCPVVGDRLHGGGDDSGADLQLSSHCMAFVCPVTQQRRVFELPAPLALTL